ncbi:Protein of unknown function [Chitinophaga costaii]|uniref:DUF2029 domain-containing protein n=1 Tax=Chitinophaga costaii TaxID=1335309 RepID=A0A1C4FLM0_9BACT|nr:glycosyltransferase family 87 protein [Chitinophaga costaii]PUZ29966.1 DUF2029 domain-containing protein [Chitinophaga costaii]SCC56792.1 Protein of unknown function [Chitinophaga costaii]
MTLKKRFSLAWLAEQEWLVLLLWFGLTIIVTIREIYAHNINDYTIYKNVFFHVRAQQPLFLAYPEYFDVNNYGPFFSLLIAPFTWLPDAVGGMLWVLVNAAFLWYAIRQLPLSRLQQNIILLFSSHELMGASSYFQFNVSVAACIILSFALILRGKDGWAACFIMIGAFVKIYGIVGCAFFFFSRHKLKFIASLLLWGALFFVLPMLIASPAYIVRCYHDWLTALKVKTEKNAQFDQGIVLQNISAMGFIRRVFHLKPFNDLLVFVPGALLFFSQYIWLKYKQEVHYQFYILCSVLLFTVLFSSSSESPTYIIAFPAVCIWYVLQNPSRANTVFFLFAFVVCSFSQSDIFSPWVRKNIAVPYAIKAFPCLVMWGVIVWQVHVRQFLRLRPVAA